MGLCRGMRRRCQRVQDERAALRVGRAVSALVSAMVPSPELESTLPGSRIATNGRAFLKRVRADKIPAGQLALWYIGGAGYIVRTATTTLLVDPFLGPSNPPDWIRNIPPAFAPDEIDALGPIDALLITHEHGDHADPVALAAITAVPGIPVLGTPAAIEIAMGAGIDAERAIVFPPDTSLQFRDLTVTAVPM